MLDKNITIFPGGEKAWLLTCTANACKNYLRSFWQRNTEPLGDKIALPTDEDRSLWEAVGKLKPNYRAVIHLYYYEGIDSHPLDTQRKKRSYRYADPEDCAGRL